MKVEQGVQGSRASGPGAGAWESLVQPTPTLLGGSWDLVTPYNWAYNLTYKPPKWLYGSYPNYK